MKKSILSDDDRLRVDKLRSLVKHNVSDYYDTDFNLLRWLQGHPGTVEQVAEKLNYHLKARSSTWQFDELGTAPRDHPIHKHWAYGITGLSGVLENVIVNIEQCGQTDYWGMIQTYSLTDVLRARIPDLENMLFHVMKVEAETGRQASILYVMDLTELKYDKQLYHLIVGPLKALAEFMSEHYVELFKYFVLVNVPAFIYGLWTIARPLLPERTRDKVRILSSSKWKEEILDFAVPGSLPDKWNLPGDHTFTSMVSLPVKFPEAEYRSNRFRVPLENEKIQIGAGKVGFIERDLKEGDSLSWWIIADGDFGFGIFRTDDGDEADIHKMDAVYPFFGFMPGPLLVPLEDTIRIEKSGCYKIYFTNSRAWWHTLTVTYVFRTESLIV